MPNTPAFSPPTFEQSGLPQKPMVQKAFDLAKHIPRAVGSAQVLAEMLPLKEIVTAHLVSFINNPRIPLETLTEQFNEQTSRNVADIRQIYDEKKDLTQIGTSIAVKASFIALAIWDTDEILKRYKDTPLSTPLLLTGPNNGDRAVIIQTSLERELRQHRRMLEDTYLPLAEWSTIPSVEKVFKKTLQALELKIALPETTPPPAAKSKPKTNGKSGPQ